MSFKPDKKLKRKRQFKDYKKKRNILRQWQKKQANRKRAGLSLKRLPTIFPKNRKYGK